MLVGEGADEGVNGIIEREFSAWAKAIDLPGKLRIMRMARAQDGETFGLLHNNASLGCHVQLDVKLIGADQVTTPMLSLPTPTFVDGIVLKKAGYRPDGNPVAEKMGLGTEFQSHDFLGPTAELVPDGQQVLPQPGDRIRESQDNAV